MLHTVNKSPLSHDALASCLRHVQPGSAILLIEDGVYGASTGTAYASQLREIAHVTPVYALRADIEARGIGDKLLDCVRLVDYGGFVDLAVEHTPVLAWL